MSTVYLHTVGFVLDGILHLWAFFWLLNAVKNLGLNAETSFTSTRRPNTPLCHSRSGHYTCCLVILLFILLKRTFMAAHKGTFGF